MSCDIKGGKLNGRLTVHALAWVACTPGGDDSCSTRARLWSATLGLFCGEPRNRDMWGCVASIATGALQRAAHRNLGRAASRG